MHHSSHHRLQLGEDVTWKAGKVYHITKKCSVLHVVQDLQRGLHRRLACLEDSRQENGQFLSAHPLSAAFLNLFLHLSKEPHRQLQKCNGRKIWVKQYSVQFSGMKSIYIRSSFFKVNMRSTGRKNWLRVLGLAGSGFSKQ